MSHTMSPSINFHFITFSLHFFEKGLHVSILRASHTVFTHVVLEIINYASAAKPFLYISSTALYCSTAYALSERTYYHVLLGQTAVLLAQAAHSSFEKQQLAWRKRRIVYLIDNGRNEINWPNITLHVQFGKKETSWPNFYYIVLEQTKEAYITCIDLRKQMIEVQVQSQ